MAKPNFFNRHLVETGENYFEHFLFAFTTAMWILVSGVILICHSFFPFTFEITASSNVKKVNEVMQRRREMLMKRIEQRAQQKDESDE